jgi:hypothetical protein
MLGWFVTLKSDVAALRASWGSVRGGWREVICDARALIKHRRLLIDTQAMTPQGMQVVLRTRLRLMGDTETDIRRDWLASSAPEAARALVATHFRVVAAASRGWGAALGMERIVARLLGTLGAAAIAAGSVERALTTDRAQLLHALLADPSLLSGVAIFVVGAPARRLLRWRLRVLFRRGLAPATGN